MATKNAIGSNKPVEMGFGGTQQVTLPTHSPLQGNGSGAIGNFGVGTDGQVLISSSSAGPVWSTITEGTGIEIINAANSIDIRVPSLDYNLSAATPFTPVLNFSVSSSGVTYAIQSGRYVNLGKCIVFAFNITLTSKGSSSGNAYITGIPGTLTGPDNIPCNIALYNTGSISGTLPCTQGIIINSSARINLTLNQYNVYSSISATNLTNTTIIYGNGLYFIT